MRDSIRRTCSALALGAVWFLFTSVHVNAAAACAYLLTISPLSAASLAVVWALDSALAQSGTLRRFPRGTTALAAVAATALVAGAMASATPLTALAVYLAVGWIEIRALRWIGSTRAHAAGGSAIRTCFQVAAWVPAFLGMALFLHALVILPLFLLALGFHLPLVRYPRGTVTSACARDPSLGRLLRRTAAVFALVWGVALACATSQSRACRVSREWDAQQPGPTRPLRLAVLGDSSAFGYLIPDPLTFGRLLERAVWPGSAPSALSVVNCAYPNAGSRSLASQAERARVFAPDLYLVYVGANESLAEPATGEPLSGNLTRFVQAAGVAPRQVVLVTYPSGLRGFQRDWLERKNRAIRGVARATGASAVDLAAEMELPLFPPRFFEADQVHPNVLGHARIASILGRELVAQGLLADPSGPP